MNPFQVVKDFEQALCKYTGAPYAVTTTSCTMALTLAVAWHLHKENEEHWAGVMARADEGDYRPVQRSDGAPAIEIPKRTYVGVPYAIQEAGGRPTFRDYSWNPPGFYQLSPLPVWDCARLFTGGMYRGEREHGTVGGRLPSGKCYEINLHETANFEGQMQSVSFHWSKTLGIQQGGAILHDNPEADSWLRRARFDGRAEGVAPKDDTFPLRRAWHCYLSPETAAAGLVRLSHLPRNNDPLPPDAYPDLSQIEAFK